MGGLEYCQILNENSRGKLDHDLYYNCPNYEKKYISFSYDKWCIGWILYELCSEINMSDSLKQQLDTANFDEWTPFGLKDAFFNELFTKYFVILVLFLKFVY